jgi:PAS domain S-box-containing protein
MVSLNKFACPEDQKAREQFVAELNEAIRILEKSGVDGEAGQSIIFTPENTRRLLEESFDGMFINVGGKIDYINSVGARILGAEDPSEIVGRPIAQVVHPDYQEIIADRIKFICRQNLPAPVIELQFLRLDGSSVDVEAMAIKVYYEGKPAIRVVFRDIGERKAIDKALRASEERFRALAETSGAAILVYQEDRFIYANPTVQKLTGYSEKELLSMNFWELIAPEFRDQVKEIGQKRQMGEAVPSRYETKVVTKDGSEKWADISAGYFTYRNKPTVILTGMDITDRKQAEAELKEAKAQAELYLDLMGHDINNMNQIAMGFLEIAIGSIRLSDEERELLEKPLNTLRNSAGLIANVRKLQKLGEGSLKYREIDLCDVLRQVIGDYSHIPGREVTIRFKPLPACYIVANDLIRDVFSNLIGNAIKHSDPQRPLTIDVSLGPVAKEGKTYYEVAVEDNGPGIPDKLKNPLFLRFPGGEGKALGNGLGLYLVRTLVHDFHGTIWVGDRVPGDYAKGAKFVVLLPAAA